MIFGLIGLIAVLLIYIAMLHLKLHEVNELVKESTILTAGDDNGLQQTYYLKFNVDKDLKIIEVNGDTLSYAKYVRENLLGQNVVGTLMEDVPANREMIAELFAQLKKRKRILSSKQVLLSADGEKIPVLLRARPILNELLQCKGISFWGYPLNQQLSLEKKLKQLQQKDALVGDILNAETFYKQLDEQVKICNRYNRPLLLIVIELADVYNFVNKGFSFDTGDRLLCLVANACVESTGLSAIIGRFELTKIGIILTDFSPDKTEDLARVLWDNLLNNIRKLNVDKVNAEMMCLYYCQRKNNDDAQNMLSRSRKYIQNSLHIHHYGIGTRDKKIKN